MLPERIAGCELDGLVRMCKWVSDDTFAEAQTLALDRGDSVGGEVEALPAAIYAVYLTGLAGSSFGLLYIGHKKIVGVDGAANKYDGVYSFNSDNSLSCALQYIIPGGVPLITGRELSEDTQVSFDFILPSLFWNGQVIRLETPTGALNMRLEKLREI